MPRAPPLAEQWPRRGYQFLHVMLRRAGVLVNRKLVLRLYRELGLAVRKRRRKRVAGRKFRCLTLVDEFTRECPVIEVDTSLPGARVVRVLEQVAAARGYPAEIRVDNGPECAGKVLDAWAYAHGVTRRFIDPGKPVQNAKVESFHGRLRDECLNEHWFLDLADARREIEAWRVRYNDERPHSALGHRTPTEFTRAYVLMNPNPQPSELSHYVALCWGPRHRLPRLTSFGRAESSRIIDDRSVDRCTNPSDSWADCHCPSVEWHHRPIALPFHSVHLRFASACDIEREADRRLATIAFAQRRIHVHHHRDR